MRFQTWEKKDLPYMKEKKISSTTLQYKCWAIVIIGCFNAAPHYPDAVWMISAYDKEIARNTARPDWINHAFSNGLQTNITLMI